MEDNSRAGGEIPGTPAPAENVIAEDEFAQIADIASRDFFGFTERLCEPEKRHIKLFYATLMQEAESLESFMDDFGARDNAQWFCFVEFIASIRNIAIAAFHLKHVQDRYPEYDTGGDTNADGEFLALARKHLDRLDSWMANLARELCTEACNLKLSAKGRKRPIDDLARLPVRRRLPRTAEHAEAKSDEERMLSLVQRYRMVVKQFRLEKLGKKYDQSKLGQLIPLQIDEVRAKEYENKLHGIQSDYDTYVKNSALERENASLTRFRTCVAVPMHFFEMVRWLVHFIERHENMNRKSDTTDKIASLVPALEVLDTAFNFGLYYCGKFLETGNRVAESIMNSCVKPVCYRLPVPKPWGFHARPSTYISLIVNDHGTDVFIVVDDQKFDARSVMTILEAGGLLADREADTVVFEGDQRVLDDIKILSEHNYCEDKPIPRELDYLRILRNL